MHMIKASLAAALAVVALAAGPALAGGQHYRVVANNPANGAKVEVPLGDDLQLKLTACESCGYRWKIIKKPDASVIAFEKRQSSISRCTSPCTGGNATERWLFDSKAIGSTVVKLGYFGPSAGSPTKTRRLRLAVVG
jgi:predicted secreted protein